MSHFPKPFFRSARNAWFVQIDDRQIKLAADKDEAFTRYHELMAQPAAAPAIPQADAKPLVVVVVDSFLDWCQQNRAPDTYVWYKERLTSFCKTIDPGMTVADLKPFHVQTWVDSQKALAPGSRRNLITAVKRSMKWAEELGYIDRSPLRYMKKPAGGRKEQVVTPDQYQALLARTADQEFKDLLTVSWEVGARPQESLRVERRHVDLAGNRWVFPASESKNKRTPRVIYLTPKAAEITRRLAAKYPNGPIFRNIKGKPWTPYATNCRFKRAQKKVGVKVSLYAMRHTWMNRMLLSGVDAFTVATLAGHSDPSMLAKHYAHLSQAPGYLSQQAMRAAS
jgi:integrase